MFWSWFHIQAQLKDQVYLIVEAKKHKQENNQQKQNETFVAASLKPFDFENVTICRFKWEVRCSRGWITHM